MPYTIDNPPAWLKNLPIGAQHLGIRVFNAVFEKTHNDNQARMAAWAQIKRKYKKVGTKWVKLTMPSFRELLTNLAHSPEAPVFRLEKIVLQSIQSGPLRWSEKQEYFLLEIKPLMMLFDKNPLEADDAVIVADKLPISSYTKIVSREEIDTGTITVLNSLQFIGKKLKVNRLLLDETLSKTDTEVQLQICMAAKSDTFTFKRNGNLLYFEALALAPGTWTGIDGHTMHYDGGVIQEGSSTFSFQRMKSRHKDRDVDVVGFTTGVRVDEKFQAWIQGYVFDQQEIKEIEADIAAGTPIGVSPELRSMTSPGTNGEYIAHSIESKGFSFVDSPACKTSWVQAFRVVNPETLNS